MTYKVILKNTLMTFSLLLVFNICTLAQKVDCKTMTDQQVVDAIYEKINEKYESQTNHINVRINEGVVTIEGWVIEKKDIKKIEKLAKKVKCVKKVINKLSDGPGIGCGPGLKTCGSICIPTSETCNIRVKGT